VPGVNGRIILKYYLQEFGIRCEISSASSRYGPVASFGNESSAFVKSVEFIDQLSDYQVFKVDPFPWN
jgi:hypothetical protein